MLKRQLTSMFLLSVLMLSSLGRLCYAQTTPFLSDGEIRMLSNEISGDRAFEHIRWLSHWHRDSGMEGYFKAAEYVVKAAKEAGMTDVRFIEKPLPGVNCCFIPLRACSLWLSAVATAPGSERVGYLLRHTTWRKLSKLA
ncbi:MAG: hypothetical protein H0V18_15440 [Pyrinomonadaceae bacterium]|nr:hypothetical protein [Pyrinomonadaceae bacterium]